MCIQPILPIEHYRNFRKMNYQQLYAIIRKKNPQGYKPSTKYKCLEILGAEYGWLKRKE